MNPGISRLIIAGLLVALVACSRADTPATSPIASAQEIAALQRKLDELTARVDQLVPEPAVLMAHVQTQHAKLYYAGHAGNWPLAGHALHEMDEALEAVQTFNDKFEDFPTPLSELVPSLVGPPLGQIHTAIQAKDRAAFDKAFASLTAACNACHATLDHGFIQVQTPAAREFSNQRL